MKKTTRVICLIVALLMVGTLVFAACQKHEVTLSRTTASITLGRSITLTAKASDGSAITWSSDNESVATVENGVVTGVALGTATITAASPAASATCVVTVKEWGYTDDGKNYTSRSSMKNTPSNWNEMDYQSNDDTAIITWINSSFFGYDYALKDPSKGRVTADGKLNVDNIDFEHHIVTYEAATKLEDVTAQYAEAWGLTEEQVEAGGYAWRITLRDDLAWDDGTPISAKDFVYSMKEQLNYLLQPFRADNYWNANGMKIHNAQNYYFQGRTIWADNGGSYTFEDLVKGEDGKYTLGGYDVKISLLENLSWLGGNPLAAYVGAYGDKMFDVTAYNQLKALAGEDGRVEVNDDTIALLTKVITAVPDWGETQEEIVNYMFFCKSYDEMTFDKVGIFEEDELNLVVVLDEAESWLKADGTLSYTISNASLPLVKESLYESLKKAPIAGSEKWTTTYNTSVATSASWGPYKLTSFQTDKQFILERNSYWYGYNLDEYKDQYLADKYVVEVIPTDEAAKMAFWKGEIDSLDFAALGAAATQYQNSDYAIFTPSTDGTAYGIQLYGNLDVLKNSGKNNGILAIRDFRWALSLAFDRKAFVEDQLVGMQVGLGLLGPGYYYDPENSLSYRGSDAAKAALLRSYGFTFENGKWTDGQVNYDDIDDATDAMTGRNLTIAKEKLALAIKELTDNAEKYGYDSTKDIVLRLGKFNDKAARRAELIQSALDSLTEGSVLQGKIKVEILEINAQKSADDFRDGKFEIYCVAGIGGAVFYPFTSMDSYLGFGSLSYHSYMDASSVKLKMTMPAGDYAGAGQTLELTIKDWFYSLNGRTDEKCSYNWSEGKCPTEVRLQILAMLEEYALGQHYTIQVANSYDAYLNTAKTSLVTMTYNTFMGLGGGGRYTRYNYTDEEWAIFLAEHNNDLSEFYKISSEN